MSWFTAAAYAGSAVLGAVGAFNNRSTQSSQASMNLLTNQYNAKMAYDTQMSNIAAEQSIASWNAAATRAMGEVQAQVTEQTAQYNAGLINMTTQYNDALMEAELESMWDAVGLDLMHLANQRAREKGQIIAAQASSGTVIAEGSNADVVANSMAQGEMDKTIVLHGADVRAKEIANARARSAWEGGMAIQKTMWEGAMGATVARYNSNAQAAGMEASMAIAGAAGANSARSQYMSTMVGGNNQYTSESAATQNNFMSGLFGAISNGVKGVGRSIPVKSQNKQTTLLS